MTRPANRLPNLIIPGAQKSGTSSLYQYLSQHPDCIMSVPKEPSFFSTEHKMADLDSYYQCFHHTPERLHTAHILGEATTGYLYEQYVPARMKKLLSPDTKFVFILRNPVNRTTSAYWFLRRRGHERRKIDDVLLLNGRSYDALYQTECALVQQAQAQRQIRWRRYQNRYDDYLWQFRYISNGFYLNHIQRFLDHFPRQNMLFLLMEQLAQEPETVMHHVEAFLGLRQYTPENTGRTYNKTDKIPKLDPITRLLRRLATVPVVKKMHQKSPTFENLYHSLTFTNKPNTDKAILTHLQQIFAAHNHKLAQTLNLDLPKWWKGKEI